MGDPRTIAEELVEAMTYAATQLNELNDYNETPAEADLRRLAKLLATLDTAIQEERDRINQMAAEVLGGGGIDAAITAWRDDDGQLWISAEPNPWAYGKWSGSTMDVPETIMAPEFRHADLIEALEAATLDQGCDE